MPSCRNLVCCRRSLLPSAYSESAYTNRTYKCPHTHTHWSTHDILFIFLLCGCANGENGSGSSNSSNQCLHRQRRGAHLDVGMAGGQRAEIVYTSIKNRIANGLMMDFYTSIGNFYYNYIELPFITMLSIKHDAFGIVGQANYNSGTKEEKENIPDCPSLAKTPFFNSAPISMRHFFSRPHRRYHSNSSAPHSRTKFYSYPVPI